MILRTTALAAVVGLLPFAATATTVVMQFDEVVGNYAEFDDTIGDSANVDVTNRTRDAFGNTSVHEEHVEHWTDNYSELKDIAFASGDGKVAELQFDVDAGYQITFDSYKFGNYFNGNSARDATFRIYDSAWNVAWEYLVDGHTGGSEMVSPNITLTGTAYFQWGTDWDIGVDDFTYTSALEDNNMAPVPLPAGLPLLMVGLGAFGLLRRRS